MFLCPPFSGSIKRLYITLITEIGFVLNAKDFVFKSYSVFHSFSQHGGGHFVARCSVNCTRRAPSTRLVTLLAC